MTELLTHPIVGGRVWRGADWANDEPWIHRLSPGELAEIDQAVADARKRGCTVPDMSPADFVLPELSQRIRAWREVVDRGRGFQLVRGLPVDRYSLEDLRLLFWGLARQLGEPEPQDAAGALMHDIRDTGQKVRNTANIRGFQTNDELQFHNDGGDAFLLLCLRTAESGGTSKLVSVAALFNRVLAESPALARVLQQPFHFDARQQQSNGRPGVQVVPILLWHAQRLHVIYKRGYIKTAQRFEDVPRLSAQQQEALDLVDHICNEPGFQLSFDMQPGDLQIGSNHSVLHSRTQYTDPADPAQQRHLLRVWVTLPGGTDLPPEFIGTREFQHTSRRRAASCAVSMN